MGFSVPPANWFVSVPFSLLAEGQLDLCIKERFQPEIGLEGDILYKTSPSAFKKVADRLAENDLACTLHAPFFDLAPGALDPHIREASRAKLRRAFELIPLFQPKVLVCHLAFEHHKHASKREAWFAHAFETWRQMLELAAPFETIIAFENTYETSPTQHLAMLDALDTPQTGFCLDTGHILAFAHNTLEDWLPALDQLVHLHLHDNDGSCDSHKGIGLGTFDFETLFSTLTTRKLQPTVTIEAHSPEDLQHSLERLTALQVLKRP